MKSILSILFCALLLTGCKNKQEADNKKLSVADYFNYTKQETENAGVKMIPITTPKGTFKVWTKKNRQQPAHQSSVAAWRSRTYARIHGML
jgi:proline iminopeptidase